MLTAEHRAIVKATVPLLETGGEALTTHFYELLLREHPEVQPFFNQANQRSGAQQRALANGVLMYARHIDQLEKLGDLVGTIVNKHVSLQIQPEHYPIVGDCLLRSIRAVLGEDIATPAVIAAWAAAYGQLADILIGAETEIYHAAASQPGGWRGGRQFRVEQRVAESDEITSFHLVPADNGPVLAHKPGQYIGLRLDVDGQDLRRNYSLSAASDGSRYRISVKREADGAVSRHLHDRVRVGDVLELFPPSGHFTLVEGKRPVVLLTGGVGITPALAMLQALIPTGRAVRFIHAARNAGVHAFRVWVDELAARHPQLQRFYAYEHHVPGTKTAPDPDSVGFIGREQLANWLPEDRDVDVYLLGPTAFMRAMKRHLIALGVPNAQTRFEFFGPATALD
jgi:nitric oxide dioxygenase